MGRLQHSRGLKANSRGRSLRAIVEALEVRSLLSMFYVDASNASTSQDGSAGDPYSTISAAISNANPAGGDTINILAGTYAENVVIDRPVVLSGPAGTGASAAVIVPVANDPDGGADIVVQASNVTIEGLTIDGSSSTLTGGVVYNGVSINAAKGITNVDPTGKQFPISGLTVENNVIQNFTGFGVLADGGEPGLDSSLSMGNTISDNTIDNIPVVSTAPIGTDQSRGISIEDNFYAMVTGNTITRAATGIQAIFTILPSGTTAAASISGNNVTEYDRGILVYTQDTDTTTFDLANNTVTADPAADATNVGIEVDRVLHATTVTLEGNNVSGASIGLKLDYDSTGDGIAVTGGTLDGNGVGVLLTNDSPPPSFMTLTACSASLSGVAISNSTQAGLEITDAQGLVNSPLPAVLSVDAATTVTGSPHGAILSGPGAQLIDAANPVLTLTSGPKSLINGSSVTFGFNASDNVTSAGDFLLSYTLDSQQPPVTFNTPGLLSLAGLPDGPHTIVIQVTDQAGNVSNSVSDTWTIDTTPPLAPSKPNLAASNDSGISSSDGITNVTTPAFGGSAEPGSTVTLTATSPTLGTLTLGTTTAAQTSGAWSIIPGTPLADGSYTVTATATDAAGNTGVPSNPLNILIDTAKPVVTLTIVPAAVSSSTSAQFGFDVSDVETNLALSYTLDGGAPVALNSNQFTLTGLSASAHTIVVQATDPAGNTGTANDSWTVSSTPVTVAPPSTPMLTASSDTGASNSDGITNNNKPTFTGTAQPGTTVTLYANSQKLGTTTAATKGGAWSFTPTSALADGAYLITATATDASKNVSGSSGTEKIAIDTSAPTVSFTQTPSSQSTSNSATFAFNASPGVSAASSLALSYTLDGGKPVVLTTAGPLTLSGLSNGSHTLVLRATDQAGNTGSATFNWTVKAAPQAPPSTPQLTADSDTGVSSTDGITNNNKPTFTGTGAAGSTVTLYAGSQKLGTTQASSKGKWTFTVSTALGDGTYSVTATATDSNGNTSSASGAEKVVIDTVAPKTSLWAFTLPSGIFDVSKDSVVIVGNASSSGSKVSSVMYTVRDSSGEVVTSGYLKIASDGSYMGLFLLDSPTGKQARSGVTDTITLTVKDVAGNVSTVTSNVFLPGTQGHS